MTLMITVFVALLGVALSVIWFAIHRQNQLARESRQREMLMMQDMAIEQAKQKQQKKTSSE